MNKKYLFLGVALIALVVLGIVYAATSCNKDKTTELNFLAYNEPDQYLKSIISDFETQNKIKINVIKLNESNYELESLNQVAPGKIDVWEMPSSWMAKQHDKLAALSTNSDLKNYQADYPAVVQSDNMINSKIYGYPLTADALVLYINNDLKSQITGRLADSLSNEQNDMLNQDPKNWDDFSVQVQSLTQKSGSNITVSGAALGTANIPMAPQLLVAMMMQQGAQMTDAEHTQATFHTNLNLFGGPSYPGAKALAYFASFGQGGNNNYSFNDSFSDPLRAFAEGKIVYYFDFSSKTTDIKLISPDLRYTTVLLPQVKETKNPLSVISYNTYTVPKNSVHQTDAWKFVQYLTSENIATNYADSAQKKALFNSSIESGADVVGQSIKMAQTWYNPDVTQTDNIFRAAITQARNGTSAQTVLDGAALQVTDLLKKIGS